MGAFGRTGECEEARREACTEEEAESWFIAAREESWGREAFADAGWRAAGSSLSEAAGREAQQPWRMMSWVSRVDERVPYVRSQMLTIDLSQRRECASR